VALPSHEEELQLPAERRAGELLDPRNEPSDTFRANPAAGLLPAALILFLVLAFVAIVWTVVAAASGAGGPG
jgi:hypothetical protein